MSNDVSAVFLGLYWGRSGGVMVLFWDGSAVVL